MNDTQSNIALKMMKALSNNKSNNIVNIHKQYITRTTSNNNQP